MGIKELIGELGDVDVGVDVFMHGNEGLVHVMKGKEI